MRLLGDCIGVGIPSSPQFMVNMSVYQLKYFIRNKDFPSDVSAGLKNNLRILGTMFFFRLTKNLSGSAGYEQDSNWEPLNRR